MEIINRSEALRTGLTKYFTGIPCKNGHVSYRYVQSGTCEMCVNGVRKTVQVDTNEKIRQNNIKIRRLELEITELQEENAHLSALTVNAAPAPIASDFIAVAQRRTAARAALVGFTYMRHVIHKLDVETARALVLAYAIERDENITIEDVWPVLKPKHGMLHEFRVHPADMDALQSQLQALYATHQEEIDDTIEKAREGALGEAMKLAEPKPRKVKTDKPDWYFK